MEYSENNTDWPSTEITLSIEIITANIIGNALNQNADDNERYVADMINIICRPILFIFGTMGRFFSKFNI